jgi:hypothetical protein
MSSGRSGQDPRGCSLIRNRLFSFFLDFPSVSTSPNFVGCHFEFLNYVFTKNLKISSSFLKKKYFNFFNLKKIKFTISLPKTGENRFQTDRFFNPCSRRQAGWTQIESGRYQDLDPNPDIPTPESSASGDMVLCCVAVQSRTYQASRVLACARGREF